MRFPVSLPNEVVAVVFHMINLMNKITLMNTSILTAFGKFAYMPLSHEDARALVHNSDEVQSAIGHQATAEILTELLEIPVLQNRIEYSQQPEEIALVFKLRNRAPEGMILSRDEIEAIGYDFALLRRIK